MEFLRQKPILSRTYTRTHTKQNIRKDIFRSCTRLHMHQEKKGGGGGIQPRCREERAVYIRLSAIIVYVLCAPCVRRVGLGEEGSFKCPRRGLLSYMYTYGVIRSHRKTTIFSGRERSATPCQRICLDTYVVYIYFFCASLYYPYRLLKSHRSTAKLKISTSSYNMHIRQHNSLSYVYVIKCNNFYTCFLLILCFR